MINLSERLKTISDMVIENEAMADVGTDHGFVPIYLLEQGKVPFAILSDVNKGPLEIAQANISESGISSEKYSLRLGNGLEVLSAGEVSTVVIAGMGGELIQQIIDYDFDKAKSFKRLILQPRTHADELRYYLTGSGFEFDDYRLVKENKRICEIFSVHPVQKYYAADEKLISDYLIKKNDPLLKEFVDHKIKAVSLVLSNLQNSNETDEYKEIWKSILSELEEVRKETE